jgi:hypothetical protein
VAEWEQQHKRRVKLLLDTSKNVTDGILADPALARQGAVIDMRYWHYLPDGSLWRRWWPEPFLPRVASGRIRRPQHARAGVPPGARIPGRVPGQAFVSWHSRVGQIPALMAGGAQMLTPDPTAGHGQGRAVDRTPLDGFVQQYLADALADMVPQDGWVAEGERNWVLEDTRQRRVLLYSLSGAQISSIRELARGKYDGVRFDPRTGQTTKAIWPRS